MPPTYEFRCTPCNAKFETVESITEYDGDGECPKCHKISRDRVFSSNIQFLGAKVQDAEYNPAFGKVVKSKRERDELAKRHGLIEIGNEKVETIHKHAEQTQA